MSNPQKKKKYSLLSLPIGRRLALGFLIPALIAALALGSVGLQSQRLLSEETTFYQKLIHTYTALNQASDSLRELDITLQGTVNEASQSSGSNDNTIQNVTSLHTLAHQLDTQLKTHLHSDVLNLDTGLRAFFAEAGHEDQIHQQLTLSASALTSWNNYLNYVDQVMTALRSGDVTTAQGIEYGQVKQAYEDTLGNLLTLTQFDLSLMSSVQDATTVEENTISIITILAVVSALLSIGLVGWIVTSTLVTRLKRLRKVVQAIGEGDFATRLEVVGGDEITDVSFAVNGMLDTIVGLLEETQRQRDELANAELLKKLHAELEEQHAALNEANARLETLATTDPLTGLPNHRTVMSRIDEELSRCGRTQEPCALLFIDIDHFKHINDTWGHRAGDAVLHEVGVRLMSCIRLEDFVGRYGGEEFAILLPTTTLDDARHIAERIRTVLAKKPCLWEAEDTHTLTTIQITASIGVAVYQKHGTTREALIEAADGAMYVAKKTGRNRVCIAGEAPLLKISMQDGEKHVQADTEVEKHILCLSAIFQKSQKQEVQDDRVPPSEPLVKFFV